MQFHLNGFKASKFCNRNVTFAQTITSALCQQTSPRNPEVLFLLFLFFFYFFFSFNLLKYFWEVLLSQAPTVCKLQ